MKFEEFKEKILAILTGKKDDEKAKNPDEKKTDDGKKTDEKPKNPDDEQKTENDEIKNLKKELEARDLKIKDYEERIGNFKDIVNTADVPADEDINVDKFLDGNRTKRED